MNLISQNCLAEGLYKLLNTCYQNPFAGTVIAFDSMCYLIDNWNNIDFANPKLILSDKQYPIISLNDVCKIEYVHYIQMTISQYLLDKDRTYIMKMFLH
jgi:uncharacterized protein (DUF1919 family)